MDWSRCDEEKTKSALLFVYDDDDDDLTWSNCLLSICPESAGQEDTPENFMMLLVLVLSAALLTLMLVIIVTVTCLQWRKNQMLEKELDERKYVDVTPRLINIR